ncbi:MAG: site-2 protease family protein [Thiohalomonadaceae bacterium]
MHGLNAVQLFAVAAIPVLFAITVHEVAHGWMARRFGDPTALMLGRLTLNPLKHIDPVGTVLVPALLLFAGGFIFGWAKPVPVTQENLRHPERDMAWVAAAGPISNLIMALLWGLMIKLVLTVGDLFPAFVEPLLLMGQYGIVINLVLMVLNLLPIPPLDGSRVVAAFLPGPLAWRYNRFETFGLLIVAVLLFSGILGNIIGPPIRFLQSAIYSLFGL